MKGKVTALAIVALVGCACAPARGRTGSPEPVRAPAAAAAESSGTVADRVADRVADSVRADTVTRITRDTVDLSQRDINRQAVQVFGDSIPTAAPWDSAAAAEPTWDIDVRSYETHARVEHFVNMFRGDARDRIAHRLERGSRYEPMIRAKFRAAGVPEDMYYLALIESGYDPHAYSRAAAVGMWQFMTSTARGTGLRVDWWVDERRDPVRSTDAAIKYMGWLKDELGSYYLAAAAYNGGSGRVSRGLTRFAEELEGTSGDDQFFVLAEQNYLPQETKDYVPQLIAAALVGKEPERYGMHVEPQPAFAYDSVRVGASVPLSAIGKAVGASIPQMQELNPHILRGMTPPAGSYFVRVPVGTAAGFDSAYAALGDAGHAKLTRVTSKKGQSLATIAKRYGRTSTQLTWYNPKLSYLKSGNLRPGQTILVPDDAVVAGALNVPDPSIERYGSSSSRRTIHVVKRGETLGGIAKKYKTSVKTLMALNGLKKSVVHPGQPLVVRGSAARRSTRSSSRVASKSGSKSGSKSSAKSASGTRRMESNGSVAPRSSSKTKATTSKKKSTTRKK
ncbi:MAG TPA: transglycosylase SLT domain-containing protein [Gemmatimonadaceae bacterium]|nr:transglycosylase SLT domain-containing protein [Gemmatimonadaceae bacterium]